MDTSESELNFPHNILLQNAIDSGLLQAKLAHLELHDGGAISLYVLPTADVFPSRANGVFSELGPGHLYDIFR